VKETIKVLRRLEPQNPDFVEIRFDLMKPRSDISEIRNATHRLLIATNRRKDQGGLFSGAEENRLATLTQAAEEAFDYVDVELNTYDLGQRVRGLKRHGANVIISYHNERSTPSQDALESVLEREKRVGADVCKIVGTARSYADSLRCLLLLSKHARRSRLVCFSMGRMGIPSRLLSPLFGAYFTFASYGTGRETASGQIPIEKLRALYSELGSS